MSTSSRFPCPYLHEDGTLNYDELRNAEDQEHALRQAAQVMRYNKEKAEDEEKRVAAATPREGALMYHTELANGVKWFICWGCHPGGQYPRDIAATKINYTGRLRPSTTRDPLQPLRDHRNRRHKGAKHFPQLVDMTEEMEAAKSDVTSDLTARVVSKKREAAAILSEKTATRRRRPETDKEVIARLQAENLRLRQGQTVAAETEASVAMPSRSQAADSGPGREEDSA